MTRLFMLAAGLCLQLAIGLRAEADTPIPQTGMRQLEAQRSAPSQPGRPRGAVPPSQQAGCNPTLLYSQEVGGAEQSDGARQVIAANRNFTAIVEDSSPVTIRPLRIIEHLSGVASISWSADSRSIASATATGVGLPSMVRVWEVASGQCRAQTILEPSLVVDAGVPIGLLGSQDAVAVPARLDWPTGPNAVSVWRFLAGSHATPLPWPDDVPPGSRFVYHGIEISTDEQLLALIANSGPGSELLVFRTSDWQLRSRIGTQQHLMLNDMRFSHSGDRIAVAVWSGLGSERTYRAIVMAAATAQPTTVIPSPELPIFSVAFSGDDNYLVTGASSGWNRLSPRASRPLMGKPQDPSAAPRDVNATPPLIRIWDLATSQEVAAIVAPDASVRRVDWSSDNRMIAAVLSDHSVMAWAWPSRTVALRVRPRAGSSEPQLCARFSPDGRMLAVCARSSLILFAIE